MGKKRWNICIWMSYILAFMAIINLKEDFPTSVIIIFCSFLLFLLGYYLKMGREVFRRKVLRLSAIYAAVMMIPLLFLQYEYYYDVKESLFRDHQFITFKAGAKHSIGSIGIFVGLAGILFIFIRLFSDIKRKYIVSALAIACFAAYAAIQVATLTEYEGIHDEKGLVFHSWNGKEEQIGWNELESVTVVPGVHHGRMSDPSDETYFLWELVFHTKSGEQIIYDSYTISNHSLQENQMIKKKVSEQGIAFYVQEMTEETKKWYQFDIELEKVDPKPFHEIFGVK